MAEAKNRSGRRAATAGSPKTETGVYVVPMELAELYYHTQIAREGIWNAAPPVIIVRPQEEFGQAEAAWIERTLSQMRQVRKPGTLRYVLPAESGDLDIDIGLIDVQIYFDGDDNRGLATDENFRQVDVLCGHQLHTRMVIASAVHRYRPDGSRSLHCHNVIFSLRKEYDGDTEHLGLLDLLPLVRAIGGPLHVIEEL